MVLLSSGTFHIVRFCCSRMGEANDQFLPRSVRNAAASDVRRPDEIGSSANCPAVPRVGGG
jgi:hypothetical protein